MRQCPARWLQTAREFGGLDMCFEWDSFKRKRIREEGKNTEGRAEAGGKVKGRAREVEESGETEVNGLSEGRSWSERQQARGAGSPARALPRLPELCRIPACFSPHLIQR